MRARAPAGRRATVSAALQDGYVLGLLSGFSVLVAAWTYPLWGGAVVMPCLLRELTGIPCPTCYGTRALLAAAAGDWSTALRFNPLIGFGGIGLFIYLPWATGTVVGDWPRPRLSPAATVKFARFGVGLVLVNWVYLIVAHT